MAAAQPTFAAMPRRHQLAVVIVLVALAAVGWGVFLAQASDDSMGMDRGGGRSADDGAMAGMRATDGGVEAAEGMPGMASMSAMEGSEGSGGMDRTATGTGDEAAAASTARVVPDLSMGGDALPFLSSWTAMMAAMMLPAAAPMVVLYARTQPGRPLNVALFAGSYLALWVSFGLAAFALALTVEELAAEVGVIADNWARAAGVLIVGAGLYEFASLKERCLRTCRSPLAFILSWWRDGAAGAVRMGLRHGLFCAGCCWLLFLVLVPIGVMDVAAMLLVAAAVFAEKVLPRPLLTRNVIAAGLIAYGAAVVVRPALLPTVA